MPFTRRTFLTSLLSLPVLALARPARAATHKVTIKSFKFSPAQINVAVGDTIVFENEDGAPHTATADAFDTGRLNRGQSAEVEITSAGTHDYICKFHPNMKGSVTAS